MSKPNYENTTRQRHLPKTHIPRGTDRAVALHGEPRCGAPNAPGSTTVVDVYVTCPKCLKLLGEER